MSLLYQFMDKKHSEGSSYKVYMMASANKFLRICYAFITVYLNTLAQIQLVLNAFVFLNCSVVWLCVVFFSYLEFPLDFCLASLSLNLLFYDTNENIWHYQYKSSSAGISHRRCWFYSIL